MANSSFLAMAASLLLISLMAPMVSSDASDHCYKPDDAIRLYANKSMFCGGMARRMEEERNEKIIRGVLKLPPIASIMGKKKTVHVAKFKTWISALSSTREKQFMKLQETLIPEAPMFRPGFPPQDESKVSVRGSLIPASEKLMCRIQKSVRRC
ncbi:hypothetical protein Sjap_006184 [Stephania japonica]|uniref:Uncharacterized protein n=1 Tax=Stephania japonica TaxID=461633 RepID=A0AAP0K5B2_9MAGN